MLYPKLFTTLKGYNRKAFAADLSAGVIVGIVALPLAIAFAIASGVSPDKGLITAIVAGFLISALGGSRVQIGGPTGAFVVIVYGIVQRYGIEGLTVATLMAGVILIVMGATGLGLVIEYIPHPVVIGFTSGIAVIIFSSQIKDLFGLQMGAVPAEFLEKWKALAGHFSSFNFYAFAISIGTILIISFWPRFSRKVPGSLIALIFSAALAKAFHWPVETIGSRFGDLPHSLPAPTLPHIDWGTLPVLIKPAFAIAILGGIESLLSAVVSDGMIGGRHRSNMELIAQGVANIFSALFGGIPATGAIARTVTNVKNGGRTPVAGIVHAFTLLVLVLFLAPLAKLIPLACLAGILAVVAYNMSEWRSFLEVMKGLPGSRYVLLATFLVTVFFDLTFAIEIGMILSVLLFMHRMAKVTNIQMYDKEHVEERDGGIIKTKIPDGVEVYEINGPFFFGVSHKFEEAARIVARMPKVRILRLRHVPIIDSTGLNSLKGFYTKCKKSHIRLMITGLHPQPLHALKTSGLLDEIQQENVFGSLRDALHEAERFLGHSPAA